MYLGQGDAVTEATGQVLKRLVPALKGPAAEVGGEIATAVQPMIKAELEAQVPKLALIGGLAFGGVLLLGVALGLLTTKERARGFFRKPVRRRRR